MLSKNLENSTSYDIFFYKFWKKARVYYTLSISRGGGAGPPLPLAVIMYRKEPLRTQWVLSKCYENHGYDCY